MTLREYLDALADLRDRCPEGHANDAVHGLTLEQYEGALLFAQRDMTFFVEQRDYLQYTRSAEYRGIGLYHERRATPDEIAAHEAKQVGRALISSEVA